MFDIIIITGSNKITLRKFHVKPHRFDKKHMDKGLVEDKLYHIIDQLNEEKLRL